MRSTILSARVAETCLIHRFDKITEKKLVNKFTNNLQKYVKSDYFEANIQRIENLDNTSFFKSLFATKKQKAKTKSFKLNLQNEIKKYRETNRISDIKTDTSCLALEALSAVLSGKNMQEIQLDSIRVLVKYAKDNRLEALDIKKKAELTSRSELLQAINSKLETVM